MLRAVVFALLFLCGASVRAQDAAELNRFGVVEGFWLPEVVCELGAGWERIIFDWAQHQPTGPDDWHTLNVDDRWLAAARDCDREVVAIFKHTPDWATDGTPGAGLPLGLYLPVDDPRNYWANFVRKSAEYYAPRGVSRFIIWNEPDIERDTYGFEFEGSLDDYYRMLQVAYLALKQGNPNAEALLAGTTYWHDVNAGRRLYLDRLLERITNDPDAAAHEHYFDIVSLHIYFRTETVYDIVRQTRQLLDSYGLRDKRIWINEFNAGPTDDPLWPVVRPQYQVDLEQQAAYIVQAAALGLAAGVERMAVYKFFDWNLPPGGEAFGLLRADGSRRPAFDSWALIIREWHDVTVAQLARGQRVDVVRLAHADGHVTVVAWATTADAAQVRVRAAQAALSDQYGRALPTQPQGDFYTLDLPGARCNVVDKCAIGGAALLLNARSVNGVQEVTASGAVDLLFD